MTDRPPALRAYHRPPHARARIVCLPHAGGAASAFREWPRHVPPGVEVLAVAYPGRQDRLAAPFAASLEAIADEVSAALLMLPPLPSALFGHSMGASVAHEVALRLAAAGRPASLLAVSGRHAPSRLHRRAVHTATEADILADVAALGDPASAALDDPMLRELVLPAVVADYRLVGAYRPQPRPVLTLDVQVHLGVADPRLPVEEGRYWREVTTAAPTAHVWPGGHFYLAEPAVAADIATTVCEALLTTSDRPVAATR